MLGRNAFVGDVCSRIVSIALPDMSIGEAARVMREQHVGCLVVVEAGSEARRLVGILTDRDIVTGVVAVQKDAQVVQVADVMCRGVVKVREDDSILDALASMRGKAVRRLPVVAQDDLLVGIVTIDDVLDLLAQEMHALAGAVHAAQRHEQGGAR